MAERKKKKRRDEDEPEKPTKEEYAVAKYLRFQVPSKEGRLVGMSVQYFIASEAVNKLQDSKWATGSDALFTTRQSCLDYCQTLMEKGLFHRALRVEKKDKKKKKLKESGDELKPETDKEKKSKKKKKDKDSDDTSQKDGEKEEGMKEKTKKDEEEKEKEKEKEKKDEKKDKKKEKKLKLTMHDEQLFVDGDEVYVWIYDPVPAKTFIIGCLLVLGAIAVCLFPLWPPEVRLGVYYVSLAGAGFIGSILALAVVRFIIFCVVWGCTMGRHHIWFLPNLTEDVGFFESFWPLYQYEYKGGDKTNKKDKKDKTKKSKSESEKDKADDQEDDNKEQGEVDSTAKQKDDQAEEGDSTTKENDATEDAIAEKGSGSETGSEETGNGFEVVEHEEVPDDVNEEDED